MKELPSFKRREAIENENPSLTPLEIIAKEEEGLMRNGFNITDHRSHRKYGDVLQISISKLGVTKAAEIVLRLGNHVLAAKLLREHYSALTAEQQRDAARLAVIAPMFCIKMFGKSNEDMQNYDSMARHMLLHAMAASSGYVGTNMFEKRLISRHESHDNEQDSLAILEGLRETSSGKWAKQILASDYSSLLTQKETALLKEITEIPEGSQSDLFRRVIR